MFPILYEQITSGTVPADYGLGVLSDCISCVVEQERNGIYELTMEYPMHGIHAEDIAYRRVLKVRPNFTDDPQLFRIDRIGKEMNGKFTVYAKHISYDLSGFPIASGAANNAASACVILENAAVGYSINTDKTVSASFVIDTPSSVKSWFAGKQGSFLDVFGTAEIKYDNFRVDFLTHAGQDRGVTIRYGKNLLELSQELEDSNLYTHVLCYYKNGEDAAISGGEVATGLSLDVKRVLILDVTNEYETTPNVLQLTAKAQEYSASHNLTVPSNNIKLNFLQSGELVDRVDLCDTVTVYYEALGISRANVKCIRTKWDCLLEKYVETEFGDVKQDLADTISESTEVAEDAKNSADSAMNAVASKKRVFISQPVPPYDVGDLWTDDGVLYYCTTPKQTSVIRQASGSVASFDSLINEDLIECECEIEPDETGFSDIVVSVADEDMEVQKVYIFDLEETVTDGGSFRIYYEIVDGVLMRKATLTRADTTTKDYDISLINIPETIVGRNNIFCNTGDISVEYYETGFSRTDWELATDYVKEDELESAVSHSSQLITGGLGGNVVMQLDENGKPYEIVVFKVDNPNDPVDLEHANKVWRWNAGGFGYSRDGYYSQNYILALNSDGQINADMITVGTLDASRVNVQDLTASMFRGHEIDLGGESNPEGVLAIRDESNNVLIRMDANGLECFGEAVGGVKPSVVFDKNGVTAYSNCNDKENTAIFWTKEQDFHMKNAVIENQMDIGNMLKFLPFEIKDTNNNIVNQGIAVVPNI